MAKFSIIIPIYNSEQFLKRCLDSVLAQTFEDFQVICIDDGSTDNSFNVLTRYKLKDKRIKVISQENCGQGSARNKGIEYVLNNSMSEYIYFLDSDDYIEQDLLESAWETFSTTDTDLICFNTEVVGDESSRLYRRARKYAQLSLVGLLNFTDNIKDLTNVYVWNKVFKTELIKNYDIRFAEKLCYEDIAFCKMYFLVSDKIYFDMRRFHHYMIREGSLMDLNFKSEIVALDHFRNWYEIFKMAVKNKEVFEAKKTIIEKWFWDYYFMTKSMVKTSGLMELEKLKAEYFKEFDKA
ncbi:TPA: hypothetical protein CPT80_06475 [Candidatus Gastranaerophilales bacterium HUM_9]|nr:MAG TPA: hypothetical protein CPT80_06475 [Candidatus Gastranaerophilales bacterium HUM_9]HBX34307.1 hypothetical protein [Cyanobacteria bacterium UBA11440]